MEQKNLTYSKGLTAVPSDMLCSDEELELCDGMTYQDGELKPIQKPKKILDGGIVNRVLFVHHVANQDNYINTDGDAVYWYNENNTEPKNKKIADITVERVESIGNVLVFSTQRGLRFGMWNTLNNTPSYEYIERLPIPNVIFSCCKNFIGEDEHYDYDNVGTHNYSNAQSLGDYSDQYRSFGSYSGILSSTYSTQGRDVLDGKAANDLIIGLYNESQKKICRGKRFFAPFFVRYALQLYTGDYYYVSNPILMFPSVRRNLSTKLYVSTGELSVRLRGELLAYKITNPNDFNENIFSKLIKGISIFVSDQISLYDTSEVKIKGYSTGNTHSQNITMFIKPEDREVPPFDGVFTDEKLFLSEDIFGTYYKEDIEITSDPDTYDSRVLECFEHKTDKDIISQLKKTSSFFKLCDIPLSDFTLSKKNIPLMANSADNSSIYNTYLDGTHNAYWGNTSDYFDKYTLENITTQEQLPADDFYSHCDFISGVEKVYNNRLTLANVKRTFFGGFTHFMAYDNGATPDFKDLDIHVFLRTDSGDKIVEAELNSCEMFGMYFYYPDVRAYKYEIYNNENFVYEGSLSAHPLLNGAFSITRIPNTGDSFPVPNIGKLPPAVKDEAEEIPNLIVTSEVNNPFVFFAKGYNYVSDAKVLGLATTTSAISQGQFGAYPLLVFTNKGIYSMAVADDGYYSGVKPPMSREVCNNPNSITEVDNAVFFTSNKGLMLITGGNVTYVSKLLKSRIKTDIVLDNYIDIEDFFSSCDIAYDYKNGMLVLYKPNTTTCFLYNFNAGTFSFVESDFIIKNDTNAYPDYLLQGDSGLFSLIQKPNEDDDENVYSGVIQTRPLKLGNAMTLKSIRQVKNLMYMNENANVSMRLFVSNDLHTWTEVGTIKGAGYKFFKIRYEFTGMKATDRFTTTVVRYEPRQSHILR